MMQAGYATGFITGKFRSSTATANGGLGSKDDGTGLVTVNATFYGYTDLDGGVTIVNFNLLATNFGSTSGKVWADGDFTYDWCGRH